MIDIRTPMGLMFTILGLILAGFGLVSDPSIYKVSLGINVNLWWGVALMAFGLVMLGLAWRAAAARRAHPGEPSDARPAVNADRARSGH